MTLSSWLNFGRPAPPGRGSAEGRKFLTPPYYTSAQCLRLKTCQWRVNKFKKYILILHGEKTSAVTKQEMSLKSVSIPMIQIHGWKLHKIPCTRNNAPTVLENIFTVCLFSSSGENIWPKWVAREAEQGTNGRGCCRCWCFCVAITPCNLMFSLLITVLYDSVVNQCRLNFEYMLHIDSYCMFNSQSRVPCGIRGCKNRPAPFPGRMSYKATKPGSVCPVS